MDHFPFPFSTSGWIFNVSFSVSSTYFMTLFHPSLYAAGDGPSNTVVNSSCLTVFAISGWECLIRNNSIPTYNPGPMSCLFLPSDFPFCCLPGNHLVRSPWCDILRHIFENVPVFLSSQASSINGTGESIPSSFFLSQFWFHSSDNHPDHCLPSGRVKPLPSRSAIFFLMAVSDQ